MTTYIVEDEKLAADRMMQLINNSLHDIKVMGTSQTGKQAVKEINMLKPEVIFLDIQLLDMTGFDVLSHLVYQPYVIFTTAYNQYAVDAFSHIAVDYLLKPLTQEKLDQAIKKLQTLKDRSLQTSNTVQISQPKIKKRTSFSIKKNDKIILVDIDNVAWCEAADKYVEIGEKNGKIHLITKTLKQLEKELPEQFVRIHRSYIINKDFVYEIHKHFKGRYIFYLNDKDRSSITSSESYAAEIKERFDF